MIIDPTSVILPDTGVILGNESDNTLTADTSGTDSIIVGKGGDDVLTGNSGDDILSCGSGNDVLNGGEGNDILTAGGGDDTVIASVGNDIYVGGSGFDTLDFSHATAGLVIDMSKGTATSAGTATGFNTSFDSFEKVIGTNFADTITGSKDADVIDGGRGNDTIRSMAGADTLTGGEGHDTFVYFKKDVMLPNGVHQGVDTITDFGGSDTIDLHDFFKDLNLKAKDAGNVIHLTDVADDATTGTIGGTMVSAKLGGAFVDVALLQGQHLHTDPQVLPAVQVAHLASDGMFVL